MAFGRAIGLALLMIGLTAVCLGACTPAEKNVFPVQIKSELSAMGCR
jgi:hypothetical protein